MHTNPIEIVKHAAKRERNNKKEVTVTNLTTNYWLVPPPRIPFSLFSALPVVIAAAALISLLTTERAYY